MPGSLTEQENTFLPLMLVAASLFVMHWTIFDFYRIETPDIDEYLVYLNHYLKLTVNIMKESLFRILHNAHLF